MSHCHPMFGVSSSCFWTSRKVFSCNSLSPPPALHRHLLYPVVPFPHQKSSSLLSICSSFHVPDPFPHSSPSASLHFSLRQNIAIKVWVRWDLWTQLLMFHLSLCLFLHGAEVFRELPVTMLDTFPDWWKVIRAHHCTPIVTVAFHHVYYFVLIDTEFPLSFYCPVTQHCGYLCSASQTAFICTILTSFVSTAHFVTSAFTSFPCPTLTNNAGSTSSTGAPPVT